MPGHDPRNRQRIDAGLPVRPRSAFVIGSPNLLHRRCRPRPSSGTYGHRWSRSRRGEGFGGTGRRRGTTPDCLANPARNRNGTSQRHKASFTNGLCRCGKYLIR
jgi:hypothetical protein